MNSPSNYSMKMQRISCFVMIAIFLFYIFLTWIFLLLLSNLLIISVESYNSYNAVWTSDKTQIRSETNAYFIFLDPIFTVVKVIGAGLLGSAWAKISNLIIEWLWYKAKYYCYRLRSIF